MYGVHAVAVPNVHELLVYHSSYWCTVLGTGES